jgi:hypothetical protein
MITTLMREKSIIKFVITTVLFCCHVSFAQVIANPQNEFDKKYTPDPNSLFNSGKKSNQSSYSSDVTIKNGIKFCPTMLIRAKAAFYYERALFKGVALQLGIGKAFGKDIVQMTGFAFASGFKGSNTLRPDEILTYSDFDESSPMISAGLKIYYSGTVFDGGYISFNYMHEVVDYTLNSKVYDRPIQGSNVATFVMNGINVGFGYTLTGGNKNNIIHEFYMNTGINMFSISRFERVDYNPPIGSQVGYYKKSSVEMSKNLFGLNFGYIIGFGL